MSIVRRTAAAAFAALSLLVLPNVASAQMSHDAGDGVSTFGEDFPHGVAFWTRREPDGCHLCAPAIDINAGLYRVQATPDDISKAFIRLHSQFGTGIRHLAFAADILWIPKLTQSSPTFSAIAQYEPISQQKRLYASAGIGMISGRDQAGNGFSPWAQGTVAYRSAIHDLTPFVQVGRVLNGSDREWEFLFGLAHPIAPYRMHVP